MFKAQGKTRILINDASGKKITELNCTNEGARNEVLRRMNEALEMSKRPAKAPRARAKVEKAGV